ncbi:MULTISPECIES: YjjG family noncanonical pyrimidine nucleotidase [unclassified Gemella]|uniref:YjjG family noncanonical pyrimidine nucleotidase n=1 Tax=unclassified Gemella TaxID=2624949 RepID=UPI0010737513|nr:MULTISPECIES: YjjG family noncanonical pyrimidine nucleotidase [unclassified Gemella]MBF0710048.1 noncanonical pyrimidine nucleotidase, YjjG family [Gemella sp. GL1.1]MBF0746127.1 noncanonical pyrimidine nucleotidase, YjjG family [Gemella sp. 19428wG2_WT2a]NYS27392.1 noncanonical pyrimidine nucleotidase, YjjG family [Gemella sp. GL1]TFU60416.1 noncanonical pyrimidine nucleotidase, YjjG family [Gemella sp. WT2a]
MKYKYLLFDLDNTLFDFDKSQDRAVRELLRDQGIKNIEKYLDKYIEINKALWISFEKGEISREYLVNNRFKLLFSNFGIDVDGNLLAKKYEEILSKKSYTYDGVNSLLEKLKERGYQIFAATNGLSVIQRGRLANASFTKYLDDIFISEEIGYQKPENEFFEYIYNKIGGVKDEYLMIGDTLYSDIKGANDFGIDSVWCNYKNIGKVDVYANYIVKNLKELEKILC